jgi:hypothetical protein
MIDKLTKDFINKFIIEINKEDNKNRIENEIINPLICSFSNKIFPYISLLFIMYILNLILIIAVIILIIIYNKK